MRGLLVVCLLCLFGKESFAKCSDWANLYTFENVTVRDTHRDRFGNIYAVGHFFNPNFKIGSVTIPYRGGHTIFVLKFDKDLHLIWGKSFGNGNTCGATHVEVDHEDNLIVAGYYFGPIELDCIPLANAGRLDTFVAKFLSDGTIQWARHSTGTNDEEPTGLVITKSNGVVMVGHFVEGSGSFEGVAVKSFGGLDSFIVRLSSTGDVEWASSIGGTGGNLPDYINGVDVDFNDNVVITGMFESEKLFIGTLTIDKKTISENYFIAKLNSLGEPLWAKSTGMNINASGWSVTVGADNNIYVLGRFYTGTITVDGFSLTSNGDADAMLIKYSADGYALAAINFGGNEFDSGSRLDVDPYGNIVAAGYYYSHSFQVGPFTETKPESSSDVFVIRFNTDLNPLCISKIGGSAEANIWNLHVDGAGNTWLAVENMFGSGQVVFDSEYVVGSEVSTMLVSMGNLDNFNAGSPVFTVDIDLGAGKDLCSGAGVILDAGQWCHPIITWQDGSHDRFYEVMQPGEYWVEVEVSGVVARDTVNFFPAFPQTLNLGKDTTLCVGQSLLLSAGNLCGLTPEWQDGTTKSTLVVTQPGHYSVTISDGTKTISDEISVSYFPLPEVHLGVDKTICGNEIIAMNVTQTFPCEYEWNDGSHLPTRSVSEPGAYWVKVRSHCLSVSDTIKITKPGPLEVDLGEDRIICAGQTMTLGSEVPGAVSYKWQDGTVKALLNANADGTYRVRVWNGCVEDTDSVRLVVLNPKNLILPNVITPNNDHKNDFFVIPEMLRGSQLKIYNRWGEDVYYNSNYQNNWFGENQSPGTYYYTLQSVCPDPIKGSIHLLKN